MDWPHTKHKHGNQRNIEKFLSTSIYVFQFVNYTIFIQQENCKTTDLIMAKKIVENMFNLNETKTSKARYMGHMVLQL